MSGIPLERQFFTRDVRAVARGLLGKLLLHDRGGKITAGYIVETEAYDESDPASHSCNGPSQRNEAMFREGGHAYVYLSYGVHWCFNVSADREGYGAAVLVRALEPTGGLELMRRRRGLPKSADPRSLAGGPGRLTRAMSINSRHNGVDLTGGPLRVLDPDVPLQGVEIAVTPRIGISKATEQPWRFIVSSSRFVSRPR
jgi:DNA-3-methyladenine glycosylase